MRLSHKSDSYSSLDGDSNCHKLSLDALIGRKSGDNFTTYEARTNSKAKFSDPRHDVIVTAKFPRAHCGHGDSEWCDYLLQRTKVAIQQANKFNGFLKNVLSPSSEHPCIRFLNLQESVLTSTSSLDKSRQKGERFVFEDRLEHFETFVLANGHVLEERPEHKKKLLEYIKRKRSDSEPTVSTWKILDSKVGELPCVLICLPIYKAIPPNYEESPPTYDESLSIYQEIPTFEESNSMYDSFPSNSIIFPSNLCIPCLNSLTPYRKYEDMKSPKNLFSAQHKKFPRKKRSVSLGTISTQVKSIIVKKRSWSLRCYSNVEKDPTDEVFRIPRKYSVGSDLDHSLLQAFIHQFFCNSHGQQIVSSLRGSRQSDDCYVLSTPVIHSIQGRYGDEDGGVEAMCHVIRHHVCSRFCRQLPDMANLLWLTLLSQSKINED